MRQSKVHFKSIDVCLVNRASCHLTNEPFHSHWNANVYTRQIRYTKLGTCRVKLSITDRNYKCIWPLMVTVEITGVLFFKVRSFMDKIVMTEPVPHVHCRRMTNVCTVRAPVFGRYQNIGTSNHYGKAHGISSGWMICNHTICCWPITSSNIFIFDHNYSVKGGLKVIDCIVQSAEYWSPYGTCTFTQICF